MQEGFKSFPTPLYERGEKSIPAFLYKGRRKGKRGIFRYNRITQSQTAKCKMKNKNNGREVNF